MLPQLLNNNNYKGVLMSVFEDFRKEFNKTSSKREGVILTNKGPEFFVDSGNYVLNKIMSGSYLNGWAQGRWGMLAGPSGAGKSFLAGNAIRAAQQQDFGILLLDSENALDDDYLIKIGVDVDAPNFLYRGIKTIPSVQKEFSDFSKLYRKFGPAKMGKFLIINDSLDMLLTGSELEKFESGEIGGDQGQHAKQIKKLLATWMQEIKEIPVVGLCTKQTYKEQDPQKAKSDPYVITESTKFAFSQIAMINKLVLKDKEKNHIGITMQVKGNKTRFTQPFQKVKIEVPYDEGMDRWSGLLEVAESLGVVEKNGGWYTYGETKFQEGNFEKVRENILQDLIKQEDRIVDVQIDEEIDTSGDMTKQEYNAKLEELHKKSLEKVNSKKKGQKVTEESND
jgi:recombination protein RecA